VIESILNTLWASHPKRIIVILCEMMKPGFGFNDFNMLHTKCQSWAVSYSGSTATGTHAHHSSGVVSGAAGPCGYVGGEGSGPCGACM